MQLYYYYYCYYTIGHSILFLHWWYWWYDIEPHYFNCCVHSHLLFILFVWYDYFVTYIVRGCSIVLLFIFVVVRCWCPHIYSPIHNIIILPNCSDVLMLLLWFLLHCCSLFDFTILFILYIGVVTLFSMIIYIYIIPSIPSLFNYCCIVLLLFYIDVIPIILFCSSVCWIILFIWYYIICIKHSHFRYIRVICILLHIVVVIPIVAFYKFLQFWILNFALLLPVLIPCLHSTRIIVVPIIVHSHYMIHCHCTLHFTLFICYWYFITLLNLLHCSIIIIFTLLTDNSHLCCPIHCSFTFWYLLTFHCCYFVQFYCCLHILYTSILSLPIPHTCSDVTPLHLFILLQFSTFVICSHFILPTINCCTFTVNSFVIDILFYYYYLFILHTHTLLIIILLFYSHLFILFKFIVFVILFLINLFLLLLQFIIHLYSIQLHLLFSVCSVLPYYPFVAIITIIVIIIIINSYIHYFVTLHCCTLILHFYPFTFPFTYNYSHLFITLLFWYIVLLINSHLH